MRKKQQDGKSVLLLCDIHLYTVSFCRKEAAIRVCL